MRTLSTLTFFSCYPEDDFNSLINFVIINKSCYCAARYLFSFKCIQIYDRLANNGEIVLSIFHALSTTSMSPPALVFAGVGFEGGRKWRRKRAAQIDVEGNTCYLNYESRRCKFYVPFMPDGGVAVRAFLHSLEVLPPENKPLNLLQLE